MKHVPFFQSSRPRNPARQAQIFSATAAETGGVLRRDKTDLHRETDYESLLAEVQARGYHLVECGDQYVIICNTGRMRVHC